MIIPILTIAIPTYNRADKLKRLLTHINAEVTKFKLVDEVDVLISDNSDVQTHESYDHFAIRIKYYWNAHNIGFDRNLIQCIAKSKTKYVWLFGDDDIIEEGILPTILEFLSSKSPDLVVMKFRQFNMLPEFDPYTENNQFLEFNNYDDIVKNILSSGKLTSFILNKNLSMCEPSNIEKFIGTGWMHQILAAESMVNSNKARIYYLNNDCAYSIEEEVKALEWAPQAFRMGSKVVQHPFFSCPQGRRSAYLKEYEKNLIKGELVLLLYGLSGFWKVKDRAAYKSYVQTIKLSDYKRLPLIYIVIFLALRVRIYKIFLPVLLVRRFFIQKNSR